MLYIKIHAMKPRTSLRKIALLPIGVLLFLLAISAQKEPPAEREITLTEGIGDKSLEADIRSIGKHSGRSVKLTVTNLTSKPIKINVPSGTAYCPEDDEEQTLIQLEDDFFVLEPKATKTHFIAAFCSELHDMSPSDGGKFKLSKSTNKKLNEAIAYLKGKNVDKSTFQDAVWAITDNSSVSSIEAKNPQTQAFRTYLAELTGQKDTWYTSIQRHTVTPERRIVREPVIVRGKLEFPSVGTSVIRQEVVDKDGVVKFAMPEATPKKSAKVTMEFAVKVGGWDPGEYTVRILKDDVELKTYPFTLG